MIADCASPMEFTNGEDYVAYLEAHQISTTHLDFGVSFYVVATARIEDYIACWARLVHSTTSVDGHRFAVAWYVDQDRPEEEKVRTRVWKAWEQVKAQMEQDGLEVQPGKWREEEPRWLS